MTLTIGNMFTIDYQPATIYEEDMLIEGFEPVQELPEDELDFYRALGYKITDPYWHMTLREPDGTVNRFWTSKDLGELLRIARGGRALYTRR